MPLQIGKSRGITMIKALQYKEVILDWFYLDDDDITIRCKKDGYRNRYKRGDVVVPYTLKGNMGYDYKGIHIPKTRTSLSFPWVLTILRGIPPKEDSVLDHINGDITNNLRDNIRVTTQSINNKNRKKNKNNTSGFTGINYNSSANLYTIRKYIKGVRVYRSSKTLEEALVILKELEYLSYEDGYTQRHGK